MKDLYAANNNALVLMSGGQDSATCLFWALKKFSRVDAITFHYGQRHEIETSAARFICEKHGVSLREVDISFIKSVVVSNLFHGSGDLHTSHPGNEALPSSYVPYRNLLFLTVAAGWADTIGADNLVTGVCQTDYSGYPDCREAFINSAQQTLNLASGRENLKIHTPLMFITKAQEFFMAGELGCLDIIINDTITCYNGTETMNEYGRGCGECPSCMLRKKGYDEFMERKGIHD